MKSVEALWAVYFVDAVGHPNTGVVVLETSRIFGGDSKFYYTGEYEIDGDQFSAMVNSTHYNGDGMTAFGFPTKDTVQLEVRGKRQGDTIVGDMWPVGHLPMKRNICLRRLADLP